LVGNVSSGGPALCPLLPHVSLAAHLISIVQILNSNRQKVACHLWDVGVRRDETGQTTSYSLSKYMDRDGDYVIMEFNEPGSTGRQYGTGRWKGLNIQRWNLEATNSPILIDTPFLI